MAVNKAVVVPTKEITSVDVPNFSAGLSLNGAYNAPVNSFVSSKDVELTIDGFLVPRRKLTDFLPDTIETTFQKFPVIWAGVIYFFTLDAGKVKFCKEGDLVWTNCGGANTVTTNNGGMPMLLRALDSVLVLNGGNGDKLCYVDLKTAGFPVVKYTLVTNPSTVPTAVTTNLPTGAQNVYYAYNYSGAVGETLLSPIKTQSISIPRDQWGKVVATPSSIKISRPAGVAPAGANYWNLYMAVAATGGVIQPTDLLLVASKIDLATLDFIDDGTLNINLGSVPPIANSTDGPRVKYGIVEEGNPIIYGDVDNPYDINIGGGGQYALDFSISNGGFTAQPEKGTNFFPTTIVGFRNGQGIPSLTILYSNTEGMSKQATLEQQTVNYGNQSFAVWGVTEQHYGSAGVAAPNSAVNYNGKLLFFSSDGIMSMDTQTNRLNVMASVNVSETEIGSLMRSIKTSAMSSVVGTGWNNKFMWCVPTDGFDTPRQILIYDNSNQKTAYYALNIPAQWIGVVTPQNSAAFVYVCQGNKTYKLVVGDGTFDIKNNISTPFSTDATGAMIGMNGTKVHNTWQADVQVVFDIRGLTGDITVGVNYRNQNGKLKTKTKLYPGPSFTPSSSGGWGDPGWSYANTPSPSWVGAPPILGGSILTPSADVRVPVRIDDIFNEAQWFYSTPVGYNNYKIRPISFDGINLGVKPGLQ